MEKKRILVVEDDRYMREMLRILLTRAGYEITTAEDGKTAIEKARKDKPDLVLTDGLIPKVHGFLVCQAIKEFENPPKVIILTAVYTKPTQRMDAMRVYRADEVLLKPFITADLLDTIGKTLGMPKRIEAAA